MNTPDLTHLNLALFIEQQQSLNGREKLGSFIRLQDEQLPDQATQLASNLVNWQITAEKKPVKGNNKILQKWLHITANTSLVIPCQRCLQALPINLEAERSFRFVNDERQMLAEDEISEEDVLVLTNPFDVQTLIEDELLLAIPLICKHQDCHSDLPYQAVDPDFNDEQKQSPFAALAELKGGLKDKG